MANPVLTPSDGEHDGNFVGTSLRYSVGASGALTGVNTRGVKSVTRNSAGSYTFKLNAPYPGGILYYAVNIIGAYTTAGGTVGVMTVDSSKSSTAPLFTIVFYAVGTQTATEVDSGVSIVIRLGLKNGIV